MAQKVLDSPTPPQPRRFTAPLLIVLTFGLLVLFTAWSGLPEGENNHLFWVGTAVLLALLFTIGFAAWHLLFRPLPVGHKVLPAIHIKLVHRQLLVVLLTVSAINLIVGAFWDEGWHGIYGVPLGEDLLWRPHLLMYFGFLSVPLVGLAAFYLLMRQGKGTLQQRFRSNPLLGWMVISATFFVYVIPADPIWHGIYGDDISAWSLPHLLLFFSFHVVMALALVVHMSTLASRRWGSVRQVQLGDIIPFLIFAFNINGGLQFITTDYDRLSVGRPLADHMLLRPEWLFPALIVLLSTLIAVAAVHTTRRVGAATVVGVLTVLTRVALVEIFNFDFLRVETWLLILPPMVAVDLVYAFTLKRDQRPPSPLLSGAGAAVAMVVVGFPLMNQMMVYPQVGVANLMPMLVAVVAATMAGSFLGQQYGDYLAANSKEVETEAKQNKLIYVPIGALFATVLFLIVFINTAAPPL
jgi:hypothetical protein